MAPLRRFLVICALGLWLGGLTLYSLVVVRNAHLVFTSHYKVGLVTQRVTEELNLIGAGALVLMLFNAIASWDAATRRLRAGLAASLGVALLAHSAVFLLHRFMDGMLQGGGLGISDTPTFHRPHEHYLIATAFEWGAGLSYLLFAILAWRREDAVPSGQP